MKIDTKLKFSQLKKGMIICYDHFPYKPVEVEWLDNERVGLKVSKPIESRLVMSSEKFDESGYVLLGSIIGQL